MSRERTVMMENRKIYEPEHELFRATVRKFFAAELMPNIAEWEKEGLIPRALWRKAGEAGLLCPTLSTEYGGAAGDFRYLCIVDEELGYTGQGLSLIHI